MGSYRQHVGLFSATMLIAGSMLGSGIYLVPADTIRAGGTGGFLMAAWGLTALLTIFAALSYGELAAMYPKAGGQYTYLREIYGPMTGFLYGWAFFAIIECGTIAAVATSFSRYLGTFIPAIHDPRWLLGPWHIPGLQLGSVTIGPYDMGFNGVRLSAVSMILFLSAVNMLGVKLGARIQNIFTVIKIAALAALIILGLTMAPAQPVAGAAFVPTGESANLGLLAALLVVQTGCLFSAEAWNAITFIAGEVKEPKRTIPLSLLIGSLLVCGLYVLACLAYLKVLGPTGIATAPGDRVGSETLKVLFGAGSGLLMAGAICISGFGCQNGLILSGARVYQAMAADGLFLKQAAKLNKWGVPAFALVIQAIWSCVLALSGTYGQLLDFVMFAALLFYVLTVGGVIIMRIRKPEMERPYKVFGYPVLPALYLVGAFAIMGALLVYRPAFTWPGLVLVALGAPIYLLVKKNDAAMEAGAEGEPALGMEE